MPVGVQRTHDRSRCQRGHDDARVCHRSAKCRLVAISRPYLEYFVVLLCDRRRVEHQDSERVCVDLTTVPLGDAITVDETAVRRAQIAQQVIGPDTD